MRRMYSKPQLLEAVEQESKVNGINLGNTTIDGILQVNEYELDEDLSITVDTAGTGFSLDYGHMRVSNGKLNIVLLLSHNGSTQPSNDAWLSNAEQVTIPASVHSKLNTITGSVIARELKPTIFSTSTALAQRDVFVAINKDADNKLLFYIRYKGANDSMATGVTGCVRFEFNFIL